jgi:hypothetical protein
MKIKYKIIDNFLEKEKFLKIKNLMLSANFPWFYNDRVSVEKLKNSFYFTHTFIKEGRVNSDICDVIYPIFNKLKLKSVIRAKSNFYPKTTEIEEHEKHIDFKFKHKGCIFYVNTNNGFTRLKNKEKIESIENRVLLFDSSIEHNSSTCTDQNGRLNININFY